jgi:glycosyltransferase involved in cell wall biosynthesis
MRAAAADGYEVFAAAPFDETSGRVGEEFTLLRYNLDNKGKNIFKDCGSLISLFRIYRSIRPSAVLHFTVKPNIYGTIAAFLLGIPVINTVTGLGNVFIHRRWITLFVKLLYRFVFRASLVVFFQNEEDRDLFLREGLVHQAKAEIVPGSGVDTERFTPRKKKTDGRFRFLLLARLLWDKGVGEYVEAAKSLTKRHPRLECQLLGFVGVQNPMAISSDIVEGWVREGIVTYLGYTDDVRPFIADSDCVVLPSYREGLPKSLLEASSMGKPVIASDVTGCREVVQNDVNGFFCKPKDARDLEEKMEAMFLLSPAKREEMGKRGRDLVLKAFREKFVVQKYLETLEKACAGPAREKERICK